MILSRSDWWMISSGSLTILNPPHPEAAKNQSAAARNCYPERQGGPREHESEHRDEEHCEADGHIARKVQETAEKRVDQGRNQSRKDEIGCRGCRLKDKVDGADEQSDRERHGDRPAARDTIALQTSIRAAAQGNRDQ